ncbi:MAG TPA: hypothetical protein VL595_19990 [Pseudonocardia sp.]|nr:hypothetical protein [Pseudonocardia sp.]
MSKEPDKSGRSPETDGESAGVPDSVASNTGAPENGAPGNGAPGNGGSRKGASKAAASGTDGVPRTGDGVSPAGDEVGEEPAPERSRAALAMDALEQVRRPVEMSVAALFLTLAALPLILIGAALALQVGAIGENLRGRLSGGGAGLDVDGLILLFRFAGVALLIAGLLFLAFTWAALKPKRWARTGATVLAVVEILLLVGAMVVTTVDPVSLGIVLLAGAGVVLMYLPHSEEFLLTSR